jgi:heat shock protein HslJ
MERRRSHSVGGRRGRAWLLLPLVLVAAGAAALAAERGFPFDQELLLDTAPLRGSKRVPGLEVQRNGAAAIDLWCASGHGRVQVQGARITIVPGGLDGDACPPERRARDAEILSVLTQVTTWRREGDAVVLIGPQILRYRPSAH